MILLDVIVGHYLPSFSGWLFLLFVLTTESFLMSKYLSKHWYDKKIMLSVIASNTITTIIGFFLFDEKNNGGHLLNWIPLFNYYGNILIMNTIRIFEASFIITLTIEIPINIFLLRTQNTKMNILWGTLIVNIITYAIGATVISIYKYYNY